MLLKAFVHIVHNLVLAFSLLFPRLVHELQLLFNLLHQLLVLRLQLLSLLLHQVLPILVYQLSMLFLYLLLNPVIMLREVVKNILSTLFFLLLDLQMLLLELRVLVLVLLGQQRVFLVQKFGSFQPLLVMVQQILIGNFITTQLEQFIISLLIERDDPNIVKGLDLLDLCLDVLIRFVDLVHLCQKLFSLFVNMLRFGNQGAFGLLRRLALVHFTHLIKLSLDKFLHLR